MSDPKASPWRSSSGEFAHPSSAHGAGGAGQFAGSGSLGSDGHDPHGLPDPRSPAAQQVTTDEVARILAAQDAAAHDARTAPPDPPRFDLISSLDLKQRPGSFKYGDSNTFDFYYARLSGTATARVPVNARKRGRVIVGFVQNVLSQHLQVHYSGSRPHLVEWSPKGQWLDTWSDEEKDWPWMGREDPAQNPHKAVLRKTVDYEPGARVDLTYEDKPAASFQNFYDGKQENGELQRLIETTDLALWLVAREEKDDAKDLRAYSIISGKRFVYTVNLTVTKTLSQLSAEFFKRTNTRMSFGDKDGKLVPPKVNFEAHAKEHGSVKGITPVLTGPSAVTELSRLMPEEIYAPVRYMWERDDN
jgi:hypothetical protein